MPAPHRLLVELIRGTPLPVDRPIPPTLAESAIEHSVAPLLDSAARESGILEERDALVQLAMHSLESAASTRNAAAALSELLDAARAVGIEVGVFKGLAIGSQWYPTPELRPAVDVDVFINPADVDRLGEFVEHLNGRPESRAAIEVMLAEGRVFEYPLSVGGVAVDIHVDPMNLVVLTRQRQLLWQRSESFYLSDGRPVRTLDLEFSIVQALLHLFRDNFADLLHTYDIKLMIENDPDWDFIASYAKGEGLTDLVRYSLGVVCDVYGVPSPLPRTLTRSGRVLIPIIWPDRILLKGTKSVAKSYRRQSLASLLVTGRRLEVTRALARRVFPPRSVIDDRFPECACPYPIALLRWRLSQRATNKRAHTAKRTQHAKV